METLHTQTMIPRCVYSILCDDVRREDNGKLFLIGVYTPDVVVPQIPFVFPQIVFLQVFDWPSAGQFSLRSRLDCITEGGVTQLVGGLSMVQIQRPGVGPHAFRFGNVNIQNTGDYVFQIFFEGQQDPIVEHKFKVYLPSMLKPPV